MCLSAKDVKEPIYLQFSKKVILDNGFYDL